MKEQDTKSIRHHYFEQKGVLLVNVFRILKSVRFGKAQFLQGHEK